MSKLKIIFALSAWIVILPYLGFPYSLKNILFSLSGLGIAFICYLLYKNFKKEETIKEKGGTFDNFSENSNFNENEIK